MCLTARSLCVRFFTRNPQHVVKLTHRCSQARNGSFHNVKNSGALIYYLQRRGSASEKLIAFPEGFRMLAGDPMRRSLAGSGIEQKGIGYVCLGGAAGETRTIPDSKCPA